MPPKLSEEPYKMYLKTIHPGHTWRKHLAVCGLLSPTNKALLYKGLTLSHFQVVHSWGSSHFCKTPSCLPISRLHRSPREGSERCRRWKWSLLKTAEPVQHGWNNGWGQRTVQLAQEPFGGSRQSSGEGECSEYEFSLCSCVINISFSSSKVGQAEPSLYPVYVQNCITII